MNPPNPDTMKQATTGITVTSRRDNHEPEPRESARWIWCALSLASLIAAALLHRTPAAVIALLSISAACASRALRVPA